MIDIHIAKDKYEKELCYKIRKEVFVGGQKIASEMDSDGLDSKSEHVILYNNKKAIGCARIRYINKDMKLERLAILDKYRGQGHGQELMKFIVEYAKKQDVNNIIMSAQQYLERFYEKFGFKKEGESYEEVGIPHIKMYRKIK